VRGNHCSVFLLSCFPANPALAAAFDQVRIGALPLLSLVLSFYFASSAKPDG